MASTATENRQVNADTNVSDTGIQNYSLKQCIVSKHYNVRKRRTDTTQLEALILGAGGVVQNLIGFFQMKGKKQSNVIEIVAGGRRLQACQNLLAAGRINEDFQLPIRIVSMEDGIKLSLIENSGRLDMHPSDQYDAYKALVDQGRTVTDVAAIYGVAPIVVSRSLKLTSISPKLFDMFRNEEVSFHQLVALSISDDHALQEAAWESIPAAARTPQALRSAVTGGDIPASDRLAIFVGVDAYEARGGELKRDLFQEHGTLLCNAPLLQQMALEKLEQAGVELRTSMGLAWVRCRIDEPSDELDGDEYMYISTQLIEYTPEASARLDALSSLRDDIDNSLDVTPYGAPEYQELEHKRDAVDSEMENMRLLTEVPAPAELHHAGLFLYVGPMGTIHRSDLVRQVNFVQPDVVADAGGESKNYDSEEGNDQEVPQTQAKPEVVRPVHSDSLTHRLTAHRTAALQKLVMDDQHVSLVLLLTAYLPKFNMGRLHRHPDGVAQLAMDTVHLKHYADDIGNNAAFIAVRETTEAEIGAVIAGVDKDNPNGLFEHLLTLDDTTLLRLLCICVGNSINTVHGNGYAKAGAVAVAKAVKLDMADWWTPTSTAYLAHVSSKRIIDVVKEGVSSEAALALSGMKKAPLVEAAAKQLATSRWVPEVMLAA